MRVLIFILNLYILVLAVLPCGDRDEVYARGPEITATVNAGKEQPHHGEICAPFCTCACCGISKTIPPQMLNGQHIFSLPPLDFSAFLFSSPKEVSLAIWQPPQLV